MAVVGQSRSRLPVHFLKNQISAFGPVYRKLQPGTAGFTGKPHILPARELQTVDGKIHPNGGLYGIRLLSAFASRLNLQIKLIPAV